MKLAHLILPVILLGACSEQSAVDYLASAKLHIANDNYETAIIELKNAVRNEPTLAEARFLLGQTYLIDHQYPRAEKELERALELGYSAELVVPLLSKAYQKTGADNALLDLPFQKVGLSAEQAAEVYFYKLQAFINLKQTDKAKNFIEKIKALQTNSPYKQLGLAYNFLLNENQEAANIALDQLLEKHPQQADALKLKANLLFRSGEIEPAITLYRTYVAAYPEDLETSFIFARVLTDNNQTEEAEPIVDRLLLINAANPLLNQLKSLARFNVKDYEKALSFSESALVKSPDDTALRLIAGVSAYYQKNAEKTHQHLSLIASILPASHQALRLLAASQLQLGLSLEASDTVGQFDNITSKDSALLSSVGLALMDNGEVAKAQNILANSPDGKTPDELARLGLLKISLNDVSGIINLEQALDNLDNAQQEQPIGKVLATAYLSTGQYDKAFSLAQTWKENEELKAEGFMLAGLTHAKKEDYSAAKVEFEQALLVSPNNAQVKMALIELEVQSDNSFTTEQEIAALNNLLISHQDFVPAIKRLFALSQQQGDTASVIKQATQALKQSPKNYALALTLSSMYYAEEGYQQAIDSLSSHPLSNKTPAKHWGILGQSFLQLAQFDQAVEHYQKWLAVSPENPEAVIGNVALLENQRSYEKALSVTEDYLESAALTQQTVPVQMHILHTHMLLLNKEFELARTAYNKLPATTKTEPAVAGLLGQLQLHDKNYQAALPNLQLAYKSKQSPKNARLVYMCLTVLNELKQAFKFLETHVEKNPSDQRNLMELAILQIAFDVNGAINSYQKAINLNEKNIVAHNNISYLYLQQSQLDLAKLHGEKAFEINPENRDVLDTLGQVALLQNQPVQALEYFSKAVKLFKASEKINETIFINYIEALYINDKVAQANNRLKGVVFTDNKIAEKVEALKLKYN